MPAPMDVLDLGGDTARIWLRMMVFSILFHILLFSGLIFLPDLQFSKPYLPSAVEVDLVTLPHMQSKPEAKSNQASSSRAEVKKAPVKPVKPAEHQEPTKPAVVKPKEKLLQAVETKPVDAPAKPVSTAQKPLQVKKSLKKKTYNASKVIRSAIARIEKETHSSRPGSVLQAIGKLKEEVESQGSVVMRDGMDRGGVSKKTLELLDIYNAEIWHRIQKNWAFSEEMVRGRIDLEATIIVKIMKKGEIRDIWFEKRSSNSYFDDSVFKAVKKSDPLPSLPPGYLGPYYEVGFRFNLSELQKRF